MVKSRLPQLSEHQIQDQCVQYLCSQGFYVTRMNSGKYLVGEGRNRRFIMGHEAGTPDLLAFKKCGFPSGKYIVNIWFIEIKVPTNKPTLLQAAKMKELEEYGAKCLVIHSLQELQQFLT